MEGIVDKNKTQNKRAFTLTELLIVVIVIGVLSAVTLPKFNRVIENRKVTEAEEMMSAVRMEQERRCTLDQNYTTNFSALSDVIASANTKNYTYSLQAQGISAKSTSGDYTLKILSYEDGSYCCTGAGCKKLNKNYPDCAGLSFPTSNCVGTEGGTTPPGGEPTPPGEESTPVEPVEPECADGEVQGSQACNGCGTRTTKKCVGGKWVDSLGTCSKKCVGGKWVDSLGTCSKTVAECTPDPECEGTQPADIVKQCECGTVTATHKCDASTNYTWVQEDFPACPTKPADVTETCSDGTTVRTKTFTCVNNVWTPGNWDKECPEELNCTPRYGSSSFSSLFFERNSSFSTVPVPQDTCDGKISYSSFSCSVEDQKNKKVCQDYYAATSDQGCTVTQDGEWLVWTEGLLDSNAGQLINSLATCDWAIFDYSNHHGGSAPPPSEVCKYVNMYGRSPGKCGAYFDTGRYSGGGTATTGWKIYQLRALSCKEKVTKCPAVTRRVECCPN